MEMVRFEIELPRGKLTPDAATILSQLRARRKKSKTDLADLEAILEIVESWGDKTFYSNTLTKCLQYCNGK